MRRSITEALRLIRITMPPKVKCSALEAMATQPAEETQPTQSVPDEQMTPAEQVTPATVQPEEQEDAAATPHTPPKRVDSDNRKAGSSSKKVRPTMASVLAMEISNDVEIHPYIVQRVLDSLEKHAVLALKERGVFRMNIMTARLRTRQAQKAEGKRVCGRDVTLKAKPERRKLAIVATKSFKQKCA